jgi:hypothetical protein
MIENKPSFITKRYIYTNMFIDQVQPLSEIIGSGNQYTGLRKYDDLVAIIQGYINNGLLTITSGSSYIFQNALTENSGIVELGGSLTKNTTIDGNNNFGIALNNLVGFSIGASGIDTFSNYIRSTAFGGITFTTDTLELQTPSVTGGSALNGQVLTLIDAITGESEWQTLTIPNLTYQNGLIKTLNIVELGGNLLHHTEINGVSNTYDMQFRDINLFTVSSDEMDIYSNNNMLVTGLDTSIKGSSTLSLNTPNIQNSLSSLGQVFTLIDPLSGSGEWQSITFPTDIFLQSGTFNTTTNNLELTLNDSTQIDIPMSALIPITTDSTLSGNGTLATPLTIAQQGAAVEDVLTWNGTTWIPQPIPSICEDLNMIPDGNYTLSTKFVALQGINIPSNYVGFDFDLPSQYGSTDATDTYLHLCAGYGGQAFYPPGSSGATTPVICTDVANIQNFINTIVIPDVNLVTGSSLQANDIIWVVNVNMTITVWYNNAISLYPFDFWMGNTNVSNAITSKDVPQISNNVLPTSSCVLTELPSICEQLDLVPTGTYSQGMSVLSHGGASNIPPTWVGLEFDYTTIFSACSFSANIADFYFVDFQHCIQTTPATPISVLDVTVVQNFIDTVLIPDLITCYGSGSVNVGDIIYTVNGTTIVVWYNPLYPPTNNNWVFGDITGSGCEKQSPSIPTLLPPPSSGGCSIVTLPIKLTEYFDVISTTNLTLLNTPVFIYGVYRNGVFQREGVSRDYTISGSIITFNIPLVNDDVSVVYEY